MTQKMGRFLSIVWLCLYLGFKSVIAFGINQPSEIEDGYFPGRSGDMLLKPTYYESPDISMVLLDQTGEIFVNNINEKISIYNVADLISCSLGLAPIHKNFAASNYIKSNFFHRPMANLLIELDSIGDNVLNDPNIGVKLDYLNSLRHGKIDGFPVKMSRISYPTSTTTLATSLISGQKPSQHGIIADAWKTSDGSINRAYSSDSSTWSRMPNLPDVISQTFHGKSLIVSLSGDEQKAKANGLNPTLMNAHPSWTNDYIAYFRPEKNDFIVTSQGNNPVFRRTFEDLTAQNIQHIFAHHYDSVLDVLTVANYNEGFVNLNYPLNKDGTTQYVSYDLSLPEDMLLFAELQSAFSLAKVLDSPNAATLIQDDFLDFYSISFTSVTTLIEKYGRHSDQVFGALYLLDKIVPIILEHFSKSYPNRLLSEVILFGSHTSSLSSNNSGKKGLISIFKRLFPSQNFDDAGLFPSLYIQDTGERSNDYCEIFNRQLKEENSGFEVFCFSPVRKIDKGVKVGRVTKGVNIDPVINLCNVVCEYSYYCHTLNWSKPTAKYWRQYCYYCDKCNTTIFHPPGGAGKGASKMDERSKDGENMQIPNDLLLNINPYAINHPLLSALTKVGSSKENIVIDADVRKYQIVLWMSFLMFFVTVYTVYSMAFMSFKKDTLIYSTFNPNWENREARR